INALNEQLKEENLRLGAEAGEQYGMDRLCQVISEQWSGSADAIKEAIITNVRQHIGEQEVFDDITLVVAKQQ
ncbi:serine/threonine-protein phosphatase, partial [Chloroflexi bacterium TSY]|nr:serine/threonine-protein phosphatase [Chloroflexi bacterium TSY]